jgi:large subunit ribosomal protein L4
MKTTTYSKTGTKATTEVTLDKAIFEVIPESTTLIAQTYEANRRNQRHSGAVAKTRGEVRGGGRKPWKQKGTGRARAGTIRSPLWRGGGVTFGPVGMMTGNKVSKTSRKVALKQALSLSAKGKFISVIEDFNPESGKTKDVVTLLNKLGFTGKVMFVVQEKTQIIDRATRNIPKVSSIQADRINVNDVLDADNIVITKKALEVLSTRLGAEK